MRFATWTVALAATAAARPSDLQERGVEEWLAEPAPAAVLLAPPPPLAPAAAAEAPASPPLLVQRALISLAPARLFGKLAPRPFGKMISVTPKSAAAQASSAAAPLAPSSVAASSAQPTASGADQPSAQYISDVLTQHNAHRSNHSAPAMTWSNSLYATALTIANTCIYAHSMQVNGGGYGQNIAAGMPTNRIAYVITEQFYNGEFSAFTFYGQPTPNMTTFESYGHFTQVVWVGSTSVACASVNCAATGLQNVASNVPPVFHVCNYGPPGNYLGEFDKNVLPPLGEPTIHA